jgi:hypothetical protein
LPNADQPRNRQDNSSAEIDPNVDSLRRSGTGYVYAGFPAALNGLFAAKEVFAAHAEGTA